MRTHGRLGLVAGLAALAAAGTLAGTAHAQSLLVTRVSAPEVAKRTCLASEASPRAGLVVRTVRAPRAGWVAARLRAAGGNWDLAVVDVKTGRTVAGSAHFGARELAEGVIDKPTTLRIQACRLSGRATTANVTLDVLKPAPAPKLQLVRVSTPTPEARQKLVALGFDRAEHPGATHTDVYLHKPGQAIKIAQSGLLSALLVPDVAARERSARKAERAAGPLAVNGLPSGRTGTYRRLMDYTAEMNALAATNPTLVKKITLPLTTYEGRPVEGIEVTENVTARDGKPVFLIMGLHHAREWPSGEHTIEWAHELVTGYLGLGTYASPSPRVVNLMQTVRTIVIPVVNPDGFNASREFGEIYGHAGGHEPAVTGDELLLYMNEYRRKNCRVNEAPVPTGNCAGPALGVASTGVDPNRNYGTFWGGPGSSADPTNETFHGVHCPGDEPVEGPSCGPFSEPETEDIRRLVSARHATTLITNHTFSNLVLRAPGLASQGLAPDEVAMKDLGDRMACENGYVSQYGWQLYDTTGTTEDWSYNTTGGYGYTFEIGPASGNFHRPYAIQTIAEYDGTAPAANAPANTCKADGQGNREAYFIAMENTANAVHHSRLTGTAPPGAVLRLKKTVQTPTSIRNANLTLKTYTDTLDTTMVVPGTGTYDWHINPSTRPLVMKDRGRPATGLPSPPVTFSGSPAGPGTPPTPDPAAPCADFDTTDPDCWNDHPFEVPAGAGIDNAQVAVQIAWVSPGSDWDMKVFRDTNGDGKSDGEPASAQVGSSGQGTTATEATSVSEPILTPGKYVVRVLNWAAAEPYTGSVTFHGPEPFQPKTLEAWTLTCEIPENTVKGSQQIMINRGQQLNLDLTQICSGSPTSVVLKGFSARSTRGRVAVTWRTASELDTLGFEVWRTAKGSSVKVNRSLIHAKRARTATGASYTLLDGRVRPGASYTYRLRAVSPSGKRTWRASATVRVTR